MYAEHVSALISTYAKESAGNLASALDSIYGQDSPPGEVVIVIDGPVDDAQHKVIAKFAADPRVRETKIVALERQHGLAGALNRGLEYCTGTYVMRLDSDDLAYPERLHQQMAYARANPGIALIGAWSREFAEPGNQTVAVKTAPVDHDDIVRALKWRNVLCHPSILVRRDALSAVGGYRLTVGMLEDYDLFVRLALNGARFHVIPRCLVHVRVSLGQRSRRGGVAYMLKEFRFRAECRRAGFLTWPEFLLSGAAYMVFRLIPAEMRGMLYQGVRAKPEVSTA